MGRGKSKSCSNAKHAEWKSSTTVLLNLKDRLGLGNIFSKAFTMKKGHRHKNFALTAWLRVSRKENTQETCQLTTKVCHHIKRFVSVVPIYKILLTNNNYQQKYTLFFPTNVSLSLELLGLTPVLLGVKVSFRILNFTKWNYTISQRLTVSH